MENKAVARKDDPVKSHEAADKLNADGAKGLRSSQKDALQCVNAFGGRTAKSMGLSSACMYLGISLSRGENFLDVATNPQRRMSELISMGYVTRDEEGICTITPEGKAELNG